jgi:hypothetical protein
MGKISTIIVKVNKHGKPMKINYLDASIGEVYWTDWTTSLKSEMIYVKQLRGMKLVRLHRVPSHLTCTGGVMQA